MLSINITKIHVSPEVLMQLLDASVWLISLNFPDSVFTFFRYIVI